MKLVWSTEDFVVAGFAYSGFPLLLSKDGRLERSAHLFFVDQLLENGGTASRATWRFYGYALYGFFKYLEDHQRQWDEPRVIGTTSVLASYRAFLSKRAERSTINGRLDALVKFFEFAKRHSFIATLPFAYKEVSEKLPPPTEVGGPHTQPKMQVVSVKLRAKRKLLKVLSAQQCQKFLDSLKNKTHHLMAQFQLSTGLRVDELVSFPERLILDPRTAPAVRAFFPVTLRPSEMRTKGSVARTIHIPRELMASLWAYRSVDRSIRLESAKGRPTELFVTERGKPYATRSIWGIYKSASRDCELDVHPHVLRHTYATHTIRCLSRSRNVGSALLYVRDRLGHSSVLSTQIYLHYADELVVTVMDSYQSELNALVGLKGP